MAMYYQHFMVWFLQMRSFVLVRRLVIARRFYVMGPFITNDSGTDLRTSG
jgi:hypothetical protein